MAVFSFDFPEELPTELMEPTDVDELCEAMLRGAAPLLEREMKREINRVTSKEYSTGAAAESIKCKSPRKYRNGDWTISITPRGYSKHTFRTGNGKKRTYEVSNALKLIWLNYGIPGHQVARPFLTRAMDNARKSVIEKMQEIYNKKVGGGT